MIAIRRFTERSKQIFGKYDELLTLFEKGKLRWFGHVSGSSGLAKTILLGTVKEKKGADNKRGGKTILKNGWGWALPAQLEQLRTRRGVTGSLQINLWCPNDLPRLWDRTE